MKTQYKALAALCILGSLALAGCGGGKGGKKDPVIVVTAVSEQITIKDVQVSSYDYASLFSITADGVSVAVESSYVDSTAVSETAGSYDVVCTYQTQRAVIEVVVTETAYTLDLAQEAIVLRVSEIAGYNFKSLFTAKVDGVSVTITDDMVESNVVAEVGTYFYKVKLGAIEKALTVTVEDNLLIVPTYRKAEIPVSELTDYDFTQLFSLYADGVAIRVTANMLDTSTLASPEVGKEYEVKLSYLHEGVQRTAKTIVKVVEDTPYVVLAKELVIYPHSGNIDPTTLFEVTKGGISVPVTADMLSGEIDYIVSGSDDKVSTITLTLGGREYEATVTVKSGAVVDYVNGERITVRKGTDKTTYAFCGDFAVTVNGIRYRSFPESYFVGLDKVDFDTVGSYTVTLRIPYCSTVPTGISQNVKFDYAEKEIVYNVVENDYSVTLGKEQVVLAKGTESYNAFSNLHVVINGRTQTLTTHADWVDFITCYAEVLSDPIDFKASGAQTVRVAVYVNGANADPVTVEYSVVIDTGIVITAKDAGVFTGSAVFTKDLFEITENGEQVEVTYDMITGKADTFTPGIYVITVEYGGVTQTATVTVFDNGIKGIYRTGLTTIPTSDDDDDDVDGDYSWGDAEGYSLTSDSVGRAASSRLSALVIDKDGSIIWNGYTASIMGGSGDNVFRVNFSNGGAYSSNYYTMYYDNGILVLDPDNHLKLGFTEYRRPLVYFNENKYSIVDHVVINYSDKYVLATSYVSYSIDAICVKDKETGEEFWYGLKVHLAEKTSADTLYNVEWGMIEFAEDFVQETDAASSLTLNGEEYSFVMQSAHTAKIAKNVTNEKYTGKTFTGEIDGAQMKLVVSGAKSFELRDANDKRVLSLAMNEFDNNKNCFVDYTTDTVFLCRCMGDEEKFSYKFVLNPEELTFTVVEKDAYYGLYQAEGKYIFLDGYGTGIVNFNTKSYVSTQFRYEVHGGIVTVHYMNTSPSFAYGTDAEFYLGEFLNTLTVKRVDGDIPDGITFENSLITDGAVVHFSTFVFAADGAHTLRNLRDSIEIITKDGVLEGDAKNACIDTSTVGFSRAGFYRIAIKVTVGGEQIGAYYSIQLLPRIENNAIAAVYGRGEIFSHSLTLDEYGRATLIANGVRYEGLYTADSDGAFLIKAFSNGGAVITASGKQVAEGILSLTCTGAVSYSDYYTTGTSRVCGITGLALREFTVGTQTVYVLSGAATGIGNVVTAELLSGTGGANSVYKITDGDDVKYVRILGWGNTAEGIQLLEDYAE